ncbi:hypothetical protein KGF57_001783 [Candida theae]|uniref:Phosphatidic acid phosphatase type 2/haloperoxidase domain-containing protein n=1 Tax=Candida theae TaxID=1198502 RepID=A0AAD5BGA5_9ASCO|nr:uncharacterized protein KGF57_001783 [Candida theae]KAI5961281.1 hypothetical protein KGF57_001783 [Candida theae]
MNTRALPPSTGSKLSTNANVKAYASDWAVVLILLVYFFSIAEHANPFQRQFSITDLSIAHPFATEERVSGIACILLASILPLAIMFSVTILKTYTNKTSSKYDPLHIFQISLLGLALSIFLDGVVTDILKNWIARPRPDFLARCGVKIDNQPGELLDVSVCSAPLGVPLLLDGMRSTPSGHSSISFAAFLYLSLWLSGQFKLFTSTPQHMYKYILVFLPLLLATYVASSRVQDYRHHFMDVILGSVLGSTIASSVYFHYWSGIQSDTCDSPRSFKNAPEHVLPL